MAFPLPLQGEEKEAPAAKEAEAPAPDPAAEALRQAATRFVEAYNAEDAAAIAKVFTTDGELIDLDGEATSGREDIEAMFKEVFAEDGKRTVSLEASSVRLVAPSVAIEDGVMHFSTDAENDPVTSIRYNAVLVKQEDGSWLVASSRDTKDATTTREHLQPLAWLVGDWVGQNDQTKLELSFDWDDNENFLLGEAVATNPETGSLTTTLRIGWNAAKSAITWWTFDGNGGFSQGDWTDDDGVWLIHSEGVTSDGEPSSANQRLQKENNEAYVWKSSGRVTGGESLPDVELRFVRTPPDADSGEPDESDGAAKDSVPEDSLGETPDR